MNKYFYIFSGFLIVIFLIFLLYRTDFSLAETNSTATKQQEQPESGSVMIKKNAAREKLLTDTSGDMFMGENYAPVMMIEYASFSCTHCADFHSTVVDPLIKSHVNTGKLKYVYRDFPTNASALAASKLAHCAGKDRYFSFAKVLFRNQQRWAFTPKYHEALQDIAKLGGIDEAGFKACMENEETEKAILEAQKNAYEVLGVNKTPFVFINGVEYDKTRTYEKIAEKIDSYLKN